MTMNNKYCLFLLFFVPFLSLAQGPPQVYSTAFGADSIGGPNISMEYYYLNANTMDELHTAVDVERKKYPNTEHFMSRTKTSVRWNWNGYGTDKCDLSTLVLGYDSVIKFPRWKLPDSLSDEDKKLWVNFIKNLAEHELGHINITIEELPNMEKRIKAADCLTANGHANGAMEEMRQAQFRYDDATFHGWLQGAKL